MTIHVSLVSKKIVNLFAGTAEDAQKDGAEIIEPTTDTVKYSDGYTEEVYGFFTLTLWSYHLPFSPRIATLNSSPMAGTGISNP